MSVTLPKTICDGIPQFYRVRAGLLLDVLLERIDEEWHGIADAWPQQLGYQSSHETLHELVEVLGWSHLELAKKFPVASPEMLINVASNTPVGSESNIRFWFKCIFDLDVESISIKREIMTSASPRITVKLNETCHEIKADEAVALLRAITPAHLEVDESSLFFK